MDHLNTNGDHAQVPRSVGGRVEVSTQDRSTLADSHEHGYASSPFGLRAEVMREPRNDDADGRVCSTSDAKHRKVSRVWIGRHEYHNQVSYRSEET